MEAKKMTMEETVALATECASKTRQLRDAMARLVGDDTLSAWQFGRAGEAADLAASAASSATFWLTSLLKQEAVTK